MCNIYIFWTGGWDSTYRMVELSRKKVTVWPIYLYDETRVSNEQELKAIDQITQMLRARKETQAVILDRKIVKVSDIPEDKEITEAWKKLADETGYGIQHEWTARVAKEYPMIEMCIEKVLVGYMPTRVAIKNHGALKVSEHGGYIIDREKSDEILNLVLGNISLPIFETTETQMLSNVKEWGYEDVMSHIWFCHNPIDGKPCGLCSPCHTKWDSDMHFLLPYEAIRRCKRAAKVEKCFGTFGGKVYKRIARKMKFL